MKLKQKIFDILAQPILSFRHGEENHISNKTISEFTDQIEELFTTLIKESKPSKLDKQFYDEDELAWNDALDEYEKRLLDAVSEV